MKLLSKSLSGLLMALLFTFIYQTAFSQSQDEGKAEMAKLHFLKGVWQGEGWTLDGSNLLSFNEVETVNLKLNGSVVMIEAFGYDKSDSAKIIVNALGIITYDQSAKKYVMRILDADGSAIDPYIEFVDEQTIEWGIPEQIKFIIQVKEKLWHEMGFKKQLDGAWKKTFEINLKKQ